MTEASVQLLDAGNLEGLLSTFARLRPKSEFVKDELRKATPYFQTNMERMRYQRFRDEGLFVGSGVVEAGCKTIIGRRRKQSGMRWTVRGANAIIALRCCDLCGRWEQFWEARCGLCHPTFMTHTHTALAPLRALSNTLSYRPEPNNGLWPLD